MDLKSNLTDRQKEIITQLDDKTYTVSYIEQWMNCRDNVFTNAPAALAAMGAHGYLQAVKNIEKNT